MIKQFTATDALLYNIKCLSQVSPETAPKSYKFFNSVCLRLAAKIIASSL